MRLLRTTFPGPAAATRVHGQFATSLKVLSTFVCEISGEGLELSKA
jgi:hypothetical protein